MPDLDRLELQLCQGHLAWIKFGEAECPLSDLVHALAAAMQNADGVMGVSPVHG